MESGGMRSRWIGWLLVLMAIGVFIQLTGFLFNNDSSRYATQIHLSLFVPSLILLLTLRLEAVFWRQLPAVLFLVLLAWVLWIAGMHEGSVKALPYWIKVVLLLMLYVFAVAKLVEHDRAFTVLIVVSVVMAAVFAWWTLYYQFGVLDRSLEYKIVRWQRLEALGWRGFADLGHPIAAGLYYGVFTVALSWLFLRLPVKPWQAIFLGIGVVGLVLYVVITFSRGAWFSLAAGGGVLLLLFPNFKSRALLTFAVMLLIVALYLFWPELQNERQVGVNGRELIWGNWASHFSEFWLFGMGAGSELYYEMSPGRSYIHAHSLYLQLWYEYGVVGIALFAVLLLSLLWKGWQCREQPLARLGVALLVFAMVAMVSDVYAVFHRPSPYWVVLWFPVGILLGLRKPGSVAHTTCG